MKLVVLAPFSSKKATQLLTEARKGMGITGVEWPGKEKYDPQRPGGKHEPWFCSKDGAERLLGKLRDEADTVYILGHCGAGLDFVCSHVLPNHQPDTVNGETATVDDVFKILKGGLDPSFRGKVKVLGCRSGLNSGAKAAFADRLAEKMRPTYAHCHFYGYDDYILQGYRKDKDTGEPEVNGDRRIITGMHKIANKGTNQPTGEGPYVRLRDVRQEFRPPVGSKP